MSLWFGASAAAPAIGAEWRLGNSGVASLTLAVQLGFVAGTLTSAIFNLADVIASRHVLAISAGAGAIGTALTIQTCLGFLLTMVSIELMPVLVRAVGWRWAFAGLAPGPVFGIWSMLRLRAVPEAEKIAQGRR